VSAAPAMAGIELDERIASGPWEVLRTGVEIQYLHNMPDAPVAALLRYAPGATVPAHRHTGAEYIYILSGSQRDASGVYTAGSFQVNPPGTTHELASDTGCVLLIIWQSPVEFL